MVNSVPVLLLGVVIISTIGSIFGYLLEPGRYGKQGMGEAAIGLSGAESQPRDRSPRLAA
jgi:hypothetical protein